jgi:hypothetical protein
LHGAGVECGRGAALLGEYGMILQKGGLYDGPIYLYSWASWMSLSNDIRMTKSGNPLFRLTARPFILIGRGEGCEVRDQSKEPKLTQMFSKMKGGNCHGSYNHPYHRRVVDGVRRWRLLLE